MIDPVRFLEVVGRSSREKPRGAKLATVDVSYTSGLPKVTFDGESSLSTKGYPYVGSPPSAGDRVVLLPVGTSYVILGKVTSQ